MSKNRVAALTALSVLFSSSVFAAEIRCYNDHGPNSASIQLTLVDDVSQWPTNDPGSQTYTETAKVSEISVELLNYDSSNYPSSSDKFTASNLDSLGSLTYVEGLNYHTSALDFSLTDQVSGQTVVGHFSLLGGTGSIFVLDKDGSQIKSFTHLFGCNSSFTPNKP